MHEELCWSLASMLKSMGCPLVDRNNASNQKVGIVTSMQRVLVRQYEKTHDLCQIMSHQKKTAFFTMLHTLVPNELLTRQISIIFRRVSFYIFPQKRI